jgi:hypothetical protein
MTDLRQTSQQAPEALAQEKREPVAIVEGVVPHLEVIIIKHILGARFPKIGDFLYTTPPRREWQSLTEEEIRELTFHNQRTLWPRPDRSDVRATAIPFARAVEQALRSKNNG